MQNQTISNVLSVFQNPPSISIIERQCSLRKRNTNLKYYVENSLISLFLSKWMSANFGHEIDIILEKADKLTGATWVTKLKTLPFVTKELKLARNKKKSMQG